MRDGSPRPPPPTLQKQAQQSAEAQSHADTLLEKCAAMHDEATHLQARTAEAEATRDVLTRHVHALQVMGVAHTRDESKCVYAWRC